MQQIVVITKNKVTNFFKQLLKYKLLLLMLLPAVVFFIVFQYIPMAGAVLAFKKYDFSLGIWGSKWIGFENFRFLFESGKLATLFANTMVYNILFMAVCLVFELTIAIILSELVGKLYKKFCQSMIFLPYFVSMVVIGAILYNFLNYRYGFINNILNSLGQEKINFYIEAGMWPVILTIANTWKYMGYGSVIYLATITGIDQEIHEAARLDGASILQRIRYIILPHLVPTIITLTLMNMGKIFKGNFDLFWNTVGKNSMLYSTTDVIDTYVYRSLLQNTNYGMSAAAGLLQSFMGLIMVLLVNAVVKKFDSDSALF